MTDRVNGFIVTLADDIRDDDIQSTLTALRMIHGVQSVKPITGEDYAIIVARERERNVFRQKLLAWLDELR